VIGYYQSAKQRKTGKKLAARIPMVEMRDDPPLVVEMHLAHALYLPGHAFARGESEIPAQIGDPSRQRPILHAKTRLSNVLEHTRQDRPISGDAGDVVERITKAHVRSA
jgi:hypothetical protein